MGGGLKQLAAKLRQSEEELRFRANHDQLTGLPNRSHIKELVEDLLSREPGARGLALAFLDLDGFKQVNDFYGHAMGDALLRCVANRIRAQIRRSDLLARISGDEFVIVLDAYADEDEVAAVLGRVQEQMRQPFQIDGASIGVSGSFGVAFHPAHGRDYETLRRNADTAMYEAKTTAKGSIGVFSSELGDQAAEKMSLEHRLRAALNKGEFYYALQPKVDVRDCCVIGYEVLARWIDEHGVVRLPGEFIDLAGKLKMLDGITTMIVGRLIRDLPRLDASLGRAVTFSINVSPRQAATIGFMESLVRSIADVDRAARFTVELTEEAFLAAGPFQARVLPLLREAGIGVSIDDFGTGYSSLATLADITADELKVDRSLVRGIHQRPRSQSILRTVESLSSALGMRVVAEGVETEMERSYLLDTTSIRLGQGFLFGKPFLPAEVSAGRRARGETRATELACVA